MKKQILTLLTILIMGNAYAQSFLNLGFEYETYKSQPRKWAIEGEGNFGAELINTDKHSGQKSLHIHLKNAETYTFLSLPKEHIAGKKIQVSGYIKCSNLDSLQIMLAFKDPIGKPQVSPIISKELNQWNLISIEATYPASYASDRLLLALIVIGSGDVGFDNVSIKIDGEDYGNAAPDFAEPTQAAIATLNAHVIPIRSIENNPSTDDSKIIQKYGATHFLYKNSDSADDSGSLKNMVSKAKIVALGENSHGSASLFKLKLQLVKYLVQEAGFTVFALESPLVEADKINDYVMNKAGTQAEVLKNLTYPSWQNEEMLNIIEWIKAYNTSARNKVSFRGFDVQDGMPALKLLQQFATQHDAELLSKLNVLAAGYETALKKNDWQSVLTEAKAISMYLAVKADLAASSMHRYAVALEQHIRLKSGVSDRDYCMAENIRQLPDKDAKIIISADNTHVTKASGKMGNYLSKAFGNAYLVIGTTYNTGTYSAYGDKEFYEVHPSFSGTYEYLFSKSRHKNFIVDLRNTTVRKILPAHAGFRSIGSRPQETTQFAEINLTDHFDIIAYLEKSEHTKKR